MPTNAIGRDSVNISLNLPKAERLLLGRLACADDKSIGQWIRERMLAGVEAQDKRTAAEIRRIRVEHRQRVAGTLCLIALAVGLVNGTDEFRMRAARRARRQETTMTVEV